MVSMAVLIRTFKGCTYRAPMRYVTKTWSVVLLSKKIHILLSQVYCVWQVVKTPTIISNKPVYEINLDLAYDKSVRTAQWTLSVIKSKHVMFCMKVITFESENHAERQMQNKITVFATKMVMLDCIRCSLVNVRFVVELQSCQVVQVLDTGL